LQAKINKVIKKSGKIKLAKKENIDLSYSNANLLKIKTLTGLGNFIIIGLIPHF
jgi:hypothetical protein